MNLRESLELYFIMGSQNCLKHPVLVLEEAIVGGITMFQFREKGTKGLKGHARVKLAIELQHMCRKYSVPFIVNDDVELALFIDADGVHIGQEDAPIEGVRRKIGGKLLGVSCHNRKEAGLAMESGADYLGVGPMFPTDTKQDCRKVRGPGVIQSIRAGGIGIPLVGIGGIHEKNASQVLKAGADGVAVISAISRNPCRTGMLARAVRDTLLES
ncbi:thiamine phosphate synthase (plasmid) [Cytobacillus spongiae]|uniref:thiamine phosphate synthase n=1 Tax=Cytobacillus spongiae TaxID=2901381 RepID=UPI001F1F3A9E|nr:thiamine phosphate synthase [Cytobacillus spongiae]UII58427.1 thiamine phosphate synthase [Cytobacillus spongiae]